ncbi:phosphatidate cytidylyltransferase [Burkholderiales bacterium]|nr:phosphatidate cytidylyltransferase [Burkholderiales bacterium]
MTPLATRVATAAVLVPCVIAALFLLPARGWAVATLGVLLVAAHEWAGLAGFAGARRLMFVAVVFAVGAALLYAAWPGLADGWPGGILVAVCGVATLFWLAVALPWTIRRWATRSPAVLALSGLVVLAGAWVALVELQSRSPWLVLAAMAIVWVADTAAYFAGRAFGRRKLAPLVSPGKTWEGVWGGLAAVAVYAVALVPLARSAGYGGPVGPAAIVAWTAIAVALAMLSVVGDLFESWQKRVAGVKDSGSLLPGHGGVLDRIDALVAAMPPAALAAYWFLGG